MVKERPLRRIAQAGARSAQYRLIHHQRERYEVKAMCKFFGVSRAAYYAWVRALDQPDPDGERMGWVQEAYEKSHRTYGYRRIALWLGKQKGIHMNHKAVLRLMKKLKIPPGGRKGKIFRRMAKAGIYNTYANLLDPKIT